MWLSFQHCTDGRNSRYWRVQIAKWDREKTTYAPHQEIFQLIRMPFGFKHAPFPFLRLMDIILSMVHWQFSMVYLNDMVIFLRILEVHIKHVRQALTLLPDAGVTIKSKKCEIFSNTNSLDHVIHPEPLVESRHEIDETCDVKHPIHIKKLRSFLGLCNIF